MPKENEEPKKAEEGIAQREITDELKESYLDYAMSVIVSRALPDVRDGLKPVHRRILWAMWDMGLTASAKFVKSARVVGETLGKFHPHGDVAVYDSMVRMAQDFSLRYPLIKGQGNFGCFTGDTKIKLTDGRSASFLELVKECKKGKKNYTYTFNHETEEIEVAEIKHPRLTGKKAELVKVTLDNGEEMRCTPDHKFMMRDGAYREAQGLKKGDSLMPGYGVPKLENALQYFENFVDIKKETPLYNHKVVQTETLKNREDVYDITIDDSHNFLLDAGVFVHNSVDGDGAAAQRYTEAKLSKIASEMLLDIEKETVEWNPNYDASRKEPSYLPAKLPNLLLNGTMGIAVGMATSIPPHNLGEIVDATSYLIEHPNATVGELMNFIPGPDFPTGGIIYDRRAIEEAYRTGKGSVPIRAVASIEEKGKGSAQIVITEIPYQVNKSELIIKMASLVQEKRIEGIKDIRDESDRDGIRIVVETKSDAIPQKILNKLFQQTDLQKNFYLNMIALVGGIQPRLLSLKDILGEYIAHRKIVVRRRAEFDLKKAKERAHILEGLVKALDVIDKVIAVIKKSKDRETAEENLIKAFKFTKIQANAILDMRLATLAALEREKLENELKEKRKLILELEDILKNPKKILQIVKSELADIEKNYGDERRTKIVKGGLKEFREEDLVPDEEAIIALSRTGYIKRMPPGTFKAQKRGGKGLIGSEVKEEDQIEHFQGARTHDNILFFTNKGKVFQTKVYEVPEATRTSKGKLIYNFLEIPQTDEISALVTYREEKDKYLTLVTKKGIIKKTSIADFANVRRTGIIAVTLKKEDELRWAMLAEQKDEIMVVTKNGQSIRFREKDVRPMGRNAAGVTAIKLKKNDEVVGLDIIKKSQMSDVKGQRLLIVMSNGYAKQTPLKEYKVQRRGGSGIKTARVTGKTGEVISARIVGSDEEEIIAFSSKGQALRTELKDIRKTSRDTQGVRVMNLKQGDKLVGIVCL